MQNVDLNKAFEKKGYVIVPGVLNASEVARLRNVLEGIFTRPNTPGHVPSRMLFPSEVLRISEVYSVMLRDCIVETLKELLGECYTMFPDYNVQRNMFGSGPGKGWHTDAGTEGMADYFWNPAYRHVKCGIYLQANDTDWGGGINVVPGGHKFPLSTSSKYLDFQVKRIFNRIGRHLCGETVKIQAGDFAVFDSRLPHAPTWPRRLQNPDIQNCHARNMPEEHNKFVIYWDSCRKEYAQNFLSHIERRANREASELIFADCLRLKFPESYPADFIAAVAAHGVQIASLEKESAMQWEQKYQKARQH